jgi:hypothetical protein
LPATFALIVEVLIEAEGWIEAGLLQLQLLQHQREHPRLEAQQRPAVATEIGGGFLDQRERRGREHFVERLIRGQHPFRQDAHLRHRIGHLGEVDFLDQQIQVLEGGLERRIQRIEAGRHHVNRSHQIDGAALAGGLPPERLRLRPLRDEQQRGDEGDPAADTA